MADPDLKPYLHTPHDDATIYTPMQVNDGSVGAPGSPPNMLHQARSAIEGSALLTMLVVVAVMIIVTMAYFVTSMFALLIAAFVVETGSSGFQDTDEIKQIMMDRTGFTITLLMPQLALLIVPIVGSGFFVGGPRRALGFVKGRWRAIAWIGAGLTTPAVGLLSSMAMGEFLEESESLELALDAMHHHATTGFLIPLLLLISVTPAICEEVLFRGFLQPRLTRWMPAWLGITFASVAFAAFHMDPVHAIGVLPLGLWLGVLAHLSRSIWPAMLGHFTNNLLSVMTSAEDEGGVFDVPSNWILVLIVTCGIVGLICMLQGIRGVSSGITKEST